MRGDFVSVVSDQDFFTRLKELVDALPGICDQTSRGACGFEHASGGRKSVAGHAPSRNVQYCARRAVEHIVIGRVNVTEIFYIRRQRLCVPADAPQQKLSIGQLLSCVQKELLHARFAIRQPVTEEAEIGLKSRIWRNRMMRFRIKSVVNRDTQSRA